MSVLLFMAAHPFLTFILVLLAISAAGTVLHYVCVAIHGWPSKSEAEEDEDEL